jgi:membrane protein DedA with SNARE-associated domain
VIGKKAIGLVQAVGRQPNLAQLRQWRNANSVTGGVKALQRGSADKGSQIIVRNCQSFVPGIGQTTGKNNRRPLIGHHTIRRRPMMDAAWPILQSLQGVPAYAMMFGLLFGCGVGLPMNEDIVLLAAAALTLKGVMEPIPLMVVAWFGLVGGDALVFHWGHRFGTRLLRIPFFARMVNERRLETVQATMRRYGPAYIFVVRFMPGVRTVLFLAAGSLKMPYRHLFIYDGLAAMIELPLLVYGVRYVGGRWEEILALIHRFQGVIVPAIVLLLLAVWLVHRHKSKEKQV